MSNSKKIINHRDIELSNIKASFNKKEICYDTIFEKIISGQIGGNKFITEFCYIENKFIRKVGIKECLGYKESDFTVGALNNDDKYQKKLTYPKDLKHKIRYDIITYSLISCNYKFTPLEDHYRLNFRMIHDDGSILNVHRSVYLFRLSDENIPLSQLSILEVSRHPLAFVKAEYITPNYKELLNLFYQKNALLLNTKFTPTERRIINLKASQYSNKEIVAELSMSSIRTVEKHMENIIRKCVKLTKEQDEAVKISRSRDILLLLSQYGLYPFYS